MMKKITTIFLLSILSVGCGMQSAGYDPLRKTFTVTEDSRSIPALVMPEDVPPVQGRELYQVTPIPQSSQKKVDARLPDRKALKKQKATWEYVHSITMAADSGMVLVINKPQYLTWEALQLAIPRAGLQVKDVSPKANSIVVAKSHTTGSVMILTLTDKRGQTVLSPLDDKGHAVPLREAKPLLRQLATALHALENKQKTPLSLVTEDSAGDTILLSTRDIKALWSETKKAASMAGLHKARTSERRHLLWLEDKQTETRWRLQLVDEKGFAKVALQDDMGRPQHGIAAQTLLMKLKQQTV